MSHVVYVETGLFSRGFYDSSLGFWLAIASL